MLVLIAALFSSCNLFFAARPATVDRGAGADVLTDVLVTPLPYWGITMIVHIVLFKLKEATAENVEKAKERLLSMEGKVEMLRHLEVGVDLIRSERSADVALYTKFDSLEDLQAYQVHPYHANEVAAYMRSVCSSVVAADYEI